MATRTSSRSGPTTTQLVLGGIVAALLALLLATVARAPLHPPFYDTISSSAQGDTAP